MHSFQNFIVRLIPSHPPPLETRIWKFVVRAPDLTSHRFPPYLSSLLATLTLKVECRVQFLLQIYTLGSLGRWFYI